MNVCKYCPMLERLFRSMYGQPATLRDSAGIMVGQSAIGVRQGDPPAFLFYCIQDFLIKLQTSFKAECGDNDSGLWSLLMILSFGAELVHAWYLSTSDYHHTWPPPQAPQVSTPWNYSTLDGICSLLVWHRAIVNIPHGD
jgi:hypothetical protein